MASENSTCAIYLKVGLFLICESRLRYQGGANVLPPRTGLTSTHLAFIQRGHAIILCLTAEPSGETPFEHAEVLFGAHEHKPSIIIVCSSSAQESRRIRHLQNIPFPTIILTTGHSPAALEAAASLIYNSPSPKLAHLLQPPSPSPQPRGASPYQAPYRPTSTATTTSTTVGAGTSLPHIPTWPITLFDPATDGPSIHALWTECLPARFSLPPTTLSALLHRPGYSKHYTVHSPSDHSIIGFCATYLTYADRAGEDLIASLAILLVRRDARGRGIGRALHDHSLRELARTRGVTRFQLGSTFPRLLAGPLVYYGGGNREGEWEEAREAPEEEWLQRRGWEMRNPKVPGQGGHTVDMVLDMRAWRPVPSRGSGVPELAASTSSSSASSLSSSFGTGEVRFRSAMQDDMRDVLEIVDTAAKKIGKMGWFDQYAALMNGTNVKDVVLGVDVVRRRIAAVALTYTPSCGTQVLANLPWAGRMGDDVGGVTCICIPGELWSSCFHFFQESFLPAAI